MTKSSAKSSRRVARLTLAHPEGLHARVAALCVQTLRDFQAEATVGWEGRTVNARSVIELLTLGAPHGSVLEVQTTGADAVAALAALTQVLEQRSS
jgi:phosphotransferase system HPr (HPr) family protein